MIDLDQMIERMERHHFDPTTGLEWEAKMFSGVNKDTGSKAFANLHPLERKILIDLNALGVKIKLFRFGSEPYVGYYQPDLNTLSLGVYPWGRFSKGIVVHEGTHARQHQEGRLKPLDDQHVVWEGEVWSLHQKGLAYFNSPWEQEAHRAQYAFLAKQGLHIPIWLRMAASRLWMKYFTR